MGSSMTRELLVVDDEPQIAEALKTFLEQKGFAVTTAPTAQAALAHLRRTHPEVVLLDLKLPDGSGLDVLSLMKDRYPGLRVVMISGTADSKSISEAFHRGASGYLIKPFDFARCFYAAMGIETVDLTTVQPAPEALARVSATLAQQYQVVPLRLTHGVLELAMADPLDTQRLDELKALVACEIKPLAMIGGELAETILRCYGIGAEVVPSGSEGCARVNGALAAGPAQEAIAQETGVVRLMNELIRHAHANRATDLHLGIGVQGPWIRERIDGMLYEVPLSSTLGTLYGSLISRIKVMSHLDIAEHRLPQDGRIWFDRGDTKLDLRVSILPTPRGESVVIRLLEPSRILQLGQLGLSEEQLRQLKFLLAKPTGLLLVTGPTGSGKSTSLYTFLSTLNTGAANIVTIEDPIERELPLLTQIQVQPKIGLTFAMGLRSILRHDPDIVMVGEIRDQETANLAVRAALTGHLVLATLHTNDAASGITRLMDLGIESFLLCSTLSGILSQRLLRLVCRTCRSASSLDAASLAPTGLPVPVRSGVVQLYHAKGCPACRETGYHGRIGAFELLTVDHHIRSLILKRTSSAQIRQSAIAQGMRTLWHTGWQHAQNGSTTLEELTRVLPPESR